MVLGINFASEFPVIGLYVSVLALIAITAGTLWQKISGSLSLSVSNGYQAIGGCLFNAILIILFEDPYFINFNTNFILGMSRIKIILVSFGAFTILMFLIKAGSVSKTTTLFFLSSSRVCKLWHGYFLEKF